MIKTTSNINERHYGIKVGDMVRLVSGLSAKVLYLHFLDNNGCTVLSETGIESKQTCEYCAYNLIDNEE